MQKFSVATSKGFIHTTDFSSACRILELEMERKKEEVEKEKEQKLQNEFEKLLEDYTPKTKEEIVKAKFGGKQS